LLHLQQISSKYSPIGCSAKATPALQCGPRRLGGIFEFLQAPVEIAGIGARDKTAGCVRRQSRIAVASTAKASSTALRVDASDSPQRRRGGKRRLVARVGPRSGGIAPLSLLEPPAPVPRPLFRLFYLV
jgi:hypothetical protein